MKGIFKNDRKKLERNFVNDQSADA